MPVVGDALLIGCHRRLDLRIAQAGIKSGLHGSRANRPDFIGERERERSGSRETEEAGQADVGIIKSYSGADKGILLLHGPFGRGDIRTPFEQRRRHAHRNIGKLVAKRRGWDGNSAGGLPIKAAIACSNCARCDADIDRLDCVFRTCASAVATSAFETVPAVILILGNLQCPPVMH